MNPERLAQNWKRTRIASGHRSAHDCSGSDKGGQSTAHGQHDEANRKELKEFSRKNTVQTSD